jgi:NDP-sugar pyrophosphorylase family protein
MRSLLICPSERDGVALLSQRLPLAAVPLLGQSLLEYWLSALALRGVKEVAVLAHDRPEAVQEIVADGRRWGLASTVMVESRELTPAEALLKYADRLEPTGSPDAIAVLDRFPELPNQSMFDDYSLWFAALQTWMPRALTVDRVGYNEVQPGVWLGCHSHISPEARLRAPCWLGQHVFVGAHASVGPNAIVEDGSFVEPGAELAESWVGPDTFVGQLARIAGSLAWGNALVNLRTNSATQVADSFLLSALRPPRRSRPRGWARKISELYTRNKGEVGMLWKHLLLHKEG